MKDRLLAVSIVICVLRSISIECRGKHSVFSFWKNFQTEGLGGQKAFDPAHYLGW
jgi:hypothetical protein